MKRKIIATSSLIVILIVLGVWWAVTSNQASPPVNQTSSNEKENTYSASEVAGHATMNDCWTIIDNAVYDLTTYVNRHPGGEEILRACGENSTSLFNSRKTDDGQPVGSGSPHSQIAREQLAQFKIGTLAIE